MNESLKYSNLIWNLLDSRTKCYGRVDPFKPFRFFLRLFNSNMQIEFFFWLVLMKSRTVLNKWNSTDVLIESIISSRENKCSMQIKHTRRFSFFYCFCFLDQLTQNVWHFCSNSLFIIRKEVFVNCKNIACISIICFNFDIM